MNTFEVAVLRVLVKRQQPLKLSALVNGFPDDSEDSVLSAVSSLKLQGYLVLDDYQPNGYVSINKSRRKEILQIVDSDIHSHKLEASHTKESYYSSIPSKEKKSFGQLITGYSISQAIKAIAISSLLIFGVAIAVGSSMPTTSPDTESIAYHQYMPYKKWSGSAHGASDYDGVKNPNLSHTPASESFVGLKDCNQKPSQQQT